MIWATQGYPPTASASPGERSQKATACSFAARSIGLPSFHIMGLRDFVQGRRRSAPSHTAVAEVSDELRSRYQLATEVFDRRRVLVVSIEMAANESSAGASTKVPVFICEVRLGLSL